MGIYFFYGDEDYLLEKELEGYKSKLDKNFSAMNYVVHDNPSYADFVSVLMTQPMMFGKMMIVIACEKILAESYEDSQLKEIEMALENNPEMLDIFFVAKYPRNEGAKPDSRRKIFKILSKYNKKEFPTIRTYKTAELSAYIVKFAKSQGLTIEDSAIQIMIDSIGNNLREFEQEIEKLALLVYPNKKITADVVKENCISNEDLFNFADYIMKQEKGKALVEFNQLLNKKHPLEILTAIQTMIRKWVLIKLYSKTKSASEISQIVGQHEFVVKQTMVKLKNVSLKSLTELKERLLKVEYSVKSGQSFDIASEVENAIIR